MLSGVVDRYAGFSLAKRIVCFISGGLLLALICWLLLGIAYCIPVEWMQKNLSESADILSAESLYPASHLTAHGQFDNYTVALMLNEAAQAGGNPFLDALQGPFSTNADLYPHEALSTLVQGGEQALETGFIERYWHGYLLVLKPLLIFMNLKQIRILFQLIFAILLCLLTMMLYRRFHKVGAAIALSFVFAFTLFDSWEGVITLPIFFSFAISIAASLWACCTRTKAWRLFVGLAFVGAMTVYFDYLDNPLLTLCLPLLIILTRVVLFLQDDHEAPPTKAKRCMMKNLLSAAVVCCIGWLIGYALFWGMKWVLVDVITGSDVLIRALDQAAFRVGATYADDYGTSPLGAIKGNVGVSGGVLYYLIVLIAVAAIGWCLLAVRLRRLGETENSFPMLFLR